MKQHITKRQLKELSNDEILKLDKFMIDAGYYEENDLHPTAQANSKRKVGMNLSIGLMIEFLDDNDAFVEEFSEPNNTANFDYGGVTIDWFDIGDEDISLCDALWEAVKEVLER